MKRLCVFILVFCLGSSFALAHPGRTDSNGGHWDRSTGEYHYHDGSSAGKNRESNSYSYTYSTPLPWQEIERYSSYSTQTEKPVAVKKAKTDDLGSIIEFIVCVVFLGGFVAIKVYTWVDDRKVSKEIEARREEQRQLQEIEDNRLRAFYQSHSLRDLSNMPKNTEIGNDGLPKIIGSVKWGAYYTRYSSSKGTRFHSSECRHGILPYHVLHCKGKSPCSVCNPEPIPDLSWYDLYKNHLQECKRLGVTPLPDNIVEFPLPKEKVEIS